MSDNYFSQDEPTLPASYTGQPGSTYDTQRSQRKPYQFPPPQGKMVLPSPSQSSQPTAYPQRQPASYANQANQGGYPGSPQPTYPARQPAQAPGSFSPAPPRVRARRSRRKGRGCLIGCLGSIIAVLLFFTISSIVLAGTPLFFTAAQRVMAFGSAISTQSPLSTQEGYMNTSNRVNILIMGYGGAGHDGAYLTDSLVVMSLIPSTHHTTLISIPRDLWVQYPPNSGNYTKINALYTQASGGKADSVAGGDAVAQKISLVTGLNINYWITINFAGFRDFINAIGGVDVNVPNAFNACYPKNDDATVDASWIKVQFNKGPQHMDGARAIEYARAREPLEVCGMGTSENQAELTDFARSARQQLIMKAALAELKQSSTWPKLYGALDSLQRTLYSNLSLADLSQFALKMDLNGAHRVGLSNQNVLVDSQSNDGQYILLPRNNDWTGIVNYVKQQLYN